jgi:hypothetical protein
VHLVIHYGPDTQSRPVSNSWATAAGDKPAARCGAIVVITTSDQPRTAATRVRSAEKPRCRFSRARPVAWVETERAGAFACRSDSAHSGLPYDCWSSQAGTRRTDTRAPAYRRDSRLGPSPAPAIHGQRGWAVPGRSDLS